MSRRNRGRHINTCPVEIKQLSLIECSKVSYICSLNYRKAKNLPDQFSKKALVEILTVSPMVKEVIILRMEGAQVREFDSRLVQIAET